jgi:hypothetical protein
MADDDLASHFEEVLDQEEGIAPERPSKREREDKPENLFPQRATDPDEEVDVDDDEGPEQEVDAESEQDEDELAAQPQEGEEEDKQETALDLGQIVAVNVDGQRAEVSLQEALNGYVRAETFHRRLNQLQEVAKEIENERAVLAQERNYYAELTPALLQQLYSMQPQEPDWDKLYAEDATSAAQLERQWRTYREKVQALAQEHERVTQEQQREEARKQAIFEDAQRRQLSQWVPEWADNKRWDRDRKSMIRTAAAVGYSEAELGQLRDARPTMILLWASRYLELMRNKPKPARTQQGAMRPGAISSRAAPNGLGRAEKRLQRSGSVRDAARAFEEDLNREG